VLRLGPVGGALIIAFIGVARGAAITESVASRLLVFGLIAAAGLLHLLAVRFPSRYAVEGAAWVVSIVAIFTAMAMAAEGH